MPSRVVLHICNKLQKILVPRRQKETDGYWATQTRFFVCLLRIKSTRQTIFVATFSTFHHPMLYSCFYIKKKKKKKPKRNYSFLFGWCVIFYMRMLSTAVFCLFSMAFIVSHSDCKAFLMVNASDDATDVAVVDNNRNTCQAYKVLFLDRMSAARCAARVCVCVCVANVCLDTDQV